MKLLYKGMKKVQFFLGSEKVPFGYEKKPVFENFPFHTLGYENFGCFFLMKEELWEAAKEEEIKIPWKDANEESPASEEQYQERFCGHGKQ